MRLNLTKFAFPKNSEANKWKEYEDAYEGDLDSKRIAVADGASDSFESRLWAKALVLSYVRNPIQLESDTAKDWLDIPINGWKESIEWDNLPYYSREKAHRGAYAALLGISFIPPKKIISNKAADWHAVGIGDVCLFQIRKNKLLRAFPIEDSTEFSLTPALLSTLKAYNEKSLKSLRTCSGECKFGDIFLLQTDAVAEWFLRQIQIGDEPWHKLLSLDWRNWQKLIVNLRKKKLMRIDDVTLLILKILR